MKTEPQDEHFSTIRSPEGEFVSKLSPQPQRSELKYSITKEATRLMQKDQQPPATGKLKGLKVGQSLPHLPNCKEGKACDCPYGYGENVIKQPPATELSKEDFDALVRDAMMWRAQEMHKMQPATEQRGFEQLTEREAMIYARGYHNGHSDALPPATDCPTGITWEEVAKWNTTACEENQKLLLQAQAAIAKLVAEIKSNCPSGQIVKRWVEDIGDDASSALDERHVAEKTKPLVDAIKRVLESGDLGNGEYATLEDALEKFNSDAKTDRSSASTLQQESPGR